MTPQDHLLSPPAALHMPAGGAVPLPTFWIRRLSLTFIFQENHCRTFMVASHPSASTIKSTDARIAIHIRFQTKTLFWDASYNILRWINLSRLIAIFGACTIRYTFLSSMDLWRYNTVCSYERAQLDPSQLFFRTSALAHCDIR